jgi:hypothetical protein
MRSFFLTPEESRFGFYQFKGSLRKVESIRREDTLHLIRKAVGALTHICMHLTRRLIGLRALSKLLKESHDPITRTTKGRAILLVLFVSFRVISWIVVTFQLFRIVS